MEHLSLYDSLAEELGINVRRMADVLVGFLEDFEASQKAQHAFYIHGDPVFSNILRTNDATRLVLKTELLLLLLLLLLVFPLLLIIYIVLYRRYMEQQVRC